MYSISARQIILLAVISAVFAAGVVACFDRYGSRFQPNTAASNEPETASNAPGGITDPSQATDERNNIEVYRATSPGVVSIKSAVVERGFFGTEENEGSGSGSVIDARGYILTNEHVVAEAARLSVNFGGDRTFPAKLVGTDPDTDLAVIKVDAPRELLTVVPLGDSDQLTVGQKVLAIGNPFALDRTLTTGVISGLQRPIRARNNRWIEGALQTDASINPGNSGGPLLDSRGRMIGINSQILSPAGGSVGVGFAVPVNIAKRVIPQLINNGYVTRPRLGITTREVENIREQVRLPVSEGVLIIEVAQSGSAAQAGLRGLSINQDGSYILGDIITAIDGEKVANSRDLTRILEKHNVGDAIQVEVVRDGQKRNLPVRLLAEQRQPPQQRRPQRGLFGR